eukprot:CAMPEP_0119557350 /NCGR_PEP_ID=MMETSP1352-20130426/9043_1 /TAXON_ID=265584 /ORGANISM="Stauroneis constricta, Strain CCMP1120" /LENGTH=367 /DNA_ID=CAMNT_0007604445 /DNA_START=140 /DNA_END=1246 /DNA_ORIENTATION=-
MDKIQEIRNELQQRLPPAEDLQMFVRPSLILVCGMLLFNLPTLIYKTRLYLRGVLYLLFCNDKKWKQVSDSAAVFRKLRQLEGNIERKTVYFVRHGESTWNDTFNKGSHRSALVFVIGFIPGLVKSFLYEAYLILSGKLDSWFYDSPISFLGLGQVEELAKFLKTKGVNETEQKHLGILRADPGSPPSKIVCSSLRRAVSTVAAGFRDRLARRLQEKILIVPALQEISRNPDALSITPAHTPIRASFIEKSSTVCNFQDIFLNQVDMSLHYGNKPVNTNGLKRMLEFCDFLFTPSVKEKHVIVGGHSIWFRSFFQAFLPQDFDHDSKKKKVINGGIVKFDLLKASADAGTAFMIDQNSIEVVYGGFN